MAGSFKWKPHLPELERLIREGKTRPQIAEHFGVAENALSAAIRRYGLYGLSPNDSSTGGSASRIDWAPLMPTLLEMMERAESASAIAERLGVSTVALSAAMERQVPKDLRSKWKAARQQAAHPKKHVPAPPVIRQPLAPFSDVSWRALFDGNPPPVPNCAFGRDRGLH
ncbi:helix-turn-helix domain-containing protein [Gluconobacter sp. R75690]|uniref:helix-turn-helix domain-containing protein n=1 Tax=unclassified Gluconobacter TaxID=2644261 RepID=UPI00188A6769|nr:MULTISPECIES: helix-turn-helix domain-containing protein [unclassified Gluconobacter]MBF0850458.1 helix-turn-helix domain-containing protein [Gluconobacter sp. R75690]MBF0879150.1 helix-turn-helix domain-containing protein [Gluconobacter sp. R75828]